MTQLSKQIAKGVVLVAGSVIAIPYSIAVLCNILYGWPTGPEKYKRALHPKKVYALNYAILQQFGNLRYAELFFRWKYFYFNASLSRVIKDIKYSQNDRFLDLYYPAVPSDRPRPVVMFVYGGAWGSGNKSMYGLLAASIADKLNAIVLCPNYCIHPQGYVDDMIQDIVDCMTWVQDDIEKFGGNKQNLILLGHSAGAHLCVMSVLELVMKRLAHDIPLPKFSTPGIPGRLPPSTVRQTNSESIHFEDQYFNGDNDTNDEGEDRPVDKKDSSGSSQSDFLVLDDKDEESSSSTAKRLQSIESGTSSIEQLDLSASMTETLAADTSQLASTTSSFILLEPEKDDNNMGQDPEKDVFTGHDEDKPKEEENSSDDVDNQDVSLLTETKDQGEQRDEDQGGGDNGESTSDPSEHTTPPIIVQAATPLTETGGMSAMGEASCSEQPLVDALSSVKAVIGLAGVYHIGDHYKHEMYRGVEDISTMGKAMYGPEHFDRFSPTTIVERLDNTISLPMMVLVHGSTDTTVPVSSTTKFADALSNTSTNVTTQILPNCSHTDICMDLMSSKRGFHDPVMRVIVETAQRVLHDKYFLKM
ncbi:unnamed protein product [Owenia fusiformis]|uniref:Uncharacterized protein n=1 Tax=Owenia fusiformis TaxID=6347 RepID=A0A8J1U7F7_OWEFU|nr:unnamed protein product [Owenia fusiformis]